MRWALTILASIGFAGGGAAYYAQHRSAGPATILRTAAIARGNLVSTISATGTVEPEELVDVGAQVMGLILEFGPDPRDPAKPVDYNSVVGKGTLLAKIEPTPYKAALEQAEATLQKSDADLLQFQAKLRQAEREWRRAQLLLPNKAISDSDYDTAQSNYESARANVASGLAAIRQNKACVDTAQINLGYCTIRSPVSGTIVERRVNIGQTVIANLNAPSLFLIAKDLRKMQVWASVNEADIGRIRVGMLVHFTVDAHQGRVFAGKVTQIRMNAQMTQNVVTYTVIVTTDNSDAALLPYLTANVQFEVEKRTGVLLAPNAALRWTPEAEQIDPAAGGRTALAPAASPKRGRLWIANAGGLVRPLDVEIGATDGTMTEISGDGAKEGLGMVTGEEGEADAGSSESQAGTEGDQTSNPFLPKPPKGSRPPPGPM